MSSQVKIYTAIQFILTNLKTNKMIIELQKKFSINCDTCKTLYRGLIAAPTKDAIKEAIHNDLTWLDNDTKHYCPKCWSINKNEEAENKK